MNMFPDTRNTHSVYGEPVSWSTLIDQMTSTSASASTNLMESRLTFEAR